jgi:hypothetical protein
VKKRLKIKKTKNMKKSKKPENQKNLRKKAPQKQPKNHQKGNGIGMGKGPKTEIFKKPTKKK